MTKKQPESGLRDNIVDAAYYCFDKYGFDKTTIGDISDKAGIARPTFYKFFKNKEAIIVEICSRETLNEAAEIDSLWKKKNNPEDVLVEGIFLVVRLAQNNKYIRYLLESDETLEMAMNFDNNASIMHSFLRDRWAQSLQPFFESQNLDDASLDEVISWITFCLTVLLKKADLVPLADEKLKHFVRNFVARPIVLRPGG